ncbi:hypothetical protein BKA69DRAFT_1062845 [Paraphysoderma sedebokerense]|nr:hypothetical protein BKA69DRAFT_1062845 [Paraphysoderma sedebokerense]
MKSRNPKPIRKNSDSRSSSIPPPSSASSSSRLLHSQKEQKFKKVPNGKKLSSNSLSAVTYSNSLPEIDFKSMDFDTLKRYANVYNIKPRSLQREDYITAISKHYSNMEVRETDVIPYFCYSLQMQGKLLKLRPNESRK